MTPRKAFFTAFFISLSVILTAYGILYFSLQTKVFSAGTNQPGIPVSTPSPQDSKTVFLEIGDDDKFYFLLRFNRIQNKISILSISPTYFLSSADRTLTESHSRAGILQCVMDTKQEFGIDIDYYLSCTWRQAGRIADNLSEFAIADLGDSLPVPVRNIFLENAEYIDMRTLTTILEKVSPYLDNQTGLAFLNETLFILIHSAKENLPRLTKENFLQEYSTLETNVNTDRLKSIEKTFSFLIPDSTTYHRNIILKDDSAAHSKVKQAITE